MVPEESDPTIHLRQLAFDIGHDPQIVIDANGILVGANGAARRQFGIGPAELGVAHQLELSHPAR